MKKILPLIIVSCLVIYLGCSKDNPPPTPTPTPTYRVVAYQANRAPSLTDVNDNIWDNAKETSLDMKKAGALPQSIASIESGPKVSNMQAIVNGGYLYLRFIWNDATHDIWRNAFYVDDTVGFVRFKQFSDLTHGEDQLFVMFDNKSGEGWDAWSWRAASLAPAGLAEDMWFKYVDSFYTYVNSHLDSSQALDSSGQPIADSFIYELVLDTTTSPGVLPFFLKDAPSTQVPEVGLINKAVITDPTYVSKDTSEFNDSVLYLQDAIHRENNPVSVDSFWVSNSNPPPDSIWVYDTTYWPATRGWKINQRIPGYLIDSAAHLRPPEQLGSRFDVRAGSEFKGEQYIVVMRRLLNTGNSDDLDLNTDSVKTRVVIANNKTDIFNADTDRSISSDVWLILK